MSWQVTEIADKDPLEAPWSVDEIGERMQASMDQWPKLLRPMEV